MKTLHKLKAARHVMLDIETLGTTPGALILEIGAAVFTIEEGVIESHKWRICPRSSFEAGFKIDAATVVWWLDQEAAGAVLGPVSRDVSDPLYLEKNKRRPLALALAEFAEWMEKQKPDYVWGKGPSFDCALLKAAWSMVGGLELWKYSKERCVRTVYDLAPEDFNWTQPGTAHDSESDARAQANNVVRILDFVLRACEPRIAEAAAAAAAEEGERGDE